MGHALDGAHVSVGEGRLVGGVREREGVVHDAFTNPGGCVGLGRRHVGPGAGPRRCGWGGVTCGAQVEVTAGAARFLRVRLPSFLPELDHLSRGSVAQNFRVKKMKRFKNFMGSPSSCISVLAGFI